LFAILWEHDGGWPGGCGGCIVSVIEVDCLVREVAGLWFHHEVLLGDRSAIVLGLWSLWSDLVCELNGFDKVSILLVLGGLKGYFFL